MHGRFVAISAPSHAAEKSGVNKATILGKHFWDFCPERHASTIRTSFADCLVNQTEPRYTIESQIGGVTETWDTTLLPINDAKVVAVAHECSRSEH